MDGVQVDKSQVLGTYIPLVKKELRRSLDLKRKFINQWQQMGIKYNVSVLLKALLESRFKIDCLAILRQSSVREQWIGDLQIGNAVVQCRTDSKSEGDLQKSFNSNATTAEIRHFTFRLIKRQLVSFSETNRDTDKLHFLGSSEMEPGTENDQCG